jgi:outer membrane biosynthesis protein TonB
MRRPFVLLLFVALCVPALAVAASKPRKRSLVGAVAVVSSFSVTVKSGDAALTCALADGQHAPEIGSRVRIACRVTDGGKLVVAAVEKLAAKPEPPKPTETVDPTPPVQTEPTRTEPTRTEPTKPEPPKTEPPKAEPPKPQPPAPPVPPATRDARGVVTTLSSDAVTVRPDAGGDSLRCRITPAPDSTAAAAKLSPGAHVVIVCRRDGDSYVLSGASPVT